MPITSVESATTEVRPAIERVPVADVVFLLEEQATAPQTIALLARFDAVDRGPDLEVLRRTVASRLSAAPQLRRRILWPRWWRGRPVWVDDARFDVADHVRAIGVPAPGDEAALLGVVGALVAEPLELDRPPWRLWLVEASGDGRPWMLWQLHHAVADGERALALLGALVDPGAPDGRAVWQPAPPPTPRDLTVDAARRVVALLGAALARLARPRRIVDRVRAGLAQTRADLRRDAPRLPFNRPLGRRRRFLLVRADLDDVRALAHAHGATVNDVVVAAFAAGVADLLRASSVPTDGLRLQVSVPVSLRQEGTPAGNAVGGMKIGVPLDTDAGDAAALIEAVAAATRARKAGPSPDAGFGMLGSELMPVPLLRAILGRALRGDQRFINSYVTDLIGPPSRVALAGAEVAEAFAIGPLSAGVGLGAAALSYAGQLSITVLADPDACPRADVVAAGIERFLRPGG